MSAPTLRTSELTIERKRRASAPDGERNTVVQVGELGRHDKVDGAADARERHDQTEGERQARPIEPPVLHLAKQRNSMNRQRNEEKHELDGVGVLRNGERLAAQTEHEAAEQRDVVVTELQRSGISCVQTGRVVGLGCRARR